MDLVARIALVARTWTPTQQLHPGNVAWLGSGCDGAPPADASSTATAGSLSDGIRARHRSSRGTSPPYLSPDERRLAFDEVYTHAPHGSVSLVRDAPMADTLRAAGARDTGGPFFLQRRSLDGLPSPTLAPGYTIVTADEAGERVRVDAHGLAWGLLPVSRSCSA